MEKEGVWERGGGSVPELRPLRSVVGSIYVSYGGMFQSCILYVPSQVGGGEGGGPELRPLRSVIGSIYVVILR